MDLLSKLKLWQVMLVFAFISFGGGLTGFSFLTGDHILIGKENIALGLGVFCLFSAFVLKYFPPRG